MVLTKQYLRYIPSAIFGVIGSQKSCVKFLRPDDGRSNLCAVGACENVLIWDIKTSEPVLTLKGEKHEAITLCASPNSEHLAVGYIDGSINVFNLKSGSLVITFRGHNSSVTALQYDYSGLRLSSGSKDTNVVVWDIVSESGLYRLKGHKGEVTQLQFIKARDVLVSSSKDMLVKFWDTDTQHCFKTLVGHRTEIYDFCLVRNESRMISGSGDGELRVYDITYLEQSEESDEEPVSAEKKIKPEMKEDEDIEEINDDKRILRCTLAGSITRQGRGRVVSMATDSTTRFIACHGQDKTVELYKVSTDEELTKYIAKKTTKLKRKRKNGTDPLPDVAITLSQEIPLVCKVETGGKLCSVDVSLVKGQLQVCALLNNNSLQLHTVDAINKTSSLTSTITRTGHRSDVRTVAFSSDNTAILTASSDTVKIWNRSSLKCIRTMSCDYALCSTFAPGDRHIILGTKSGKLQLYDVASGKLIEDTTAHSAAIWSLSLAPSKKGIVSGSADHEVKLWDFELKSTETEDSSVPSKQLSLNHSRTLQMDEDVLCVKHSGNHRLLAVALLDNTVKVFFTDTLKFFLSLYGHKLPVLCMDISTDSSLIATGSADRNVKIWGLDFGDCHKSIFAHDDSIMCLQFIPNTHMFFSGGKDGKLKQWDADNFQNIVTLKGHHAEIWSLAVSPSSNFVLTAAHDKSLRLWEKSQEPLILDEEREMEREREHEESLVTDETLVAGSNDPETDLPGKKTVDTVKAAERLMEALDLCDQELECLRDHAEECEAAGIKLPPLTVNPLFVAFNATAPEKYVLEILKRIKSSELEQSLLVLPFNYMTRLLTLLDTYLKDGREVQLVSRCTLFILRVHHGQISSARELLPVMEHLRTNLDTAVTKIQDVVGFNKAGLAFLQQLVNEKEEVMMFTDATDRARRTKKKRKQKVVLAIKT